MNEIDDIIASLDDEFWHQKELEEQEIWERHRKAVKALEGMLDETQDGWRGMRRVSDGNS